MRRIVIATPHARYDSLEQRVRDRLPCFEVVRLRDREELTAHNLDRLQPLYVFLPHWSWHIPEEVTGHFDAVAFHMTDLPFGRGGSPLQNLIVRGVHETCLSALRCTNEIDAGPVYLKRPLALDGAAEAIYRRAADLMADMIVEIVLKRPHPVPQSGSPVFFKRRRPEDSDLATLSDLRRIYDHIRMLDAEGYPRAFIETADLRLEFTDARLEDDSITAQVRIIRRRSKGMTE